MKASDLTHRVVIQRATEARDSFGQPIASWTTLAQVWAAVEYVSGAEAFQGERDYSETPVIVRIRRSSDVMSVRAKDRLLLPALASTTLQEVLATTSDTSVVVVKDVLPPENEFIARVGSELLAITSTSGTTLTATRGAFGTTAARHYAGATLNLMVPADIEAVVPRRYEIALTARRAEARLTT